MNKLREKLYDWHDSETNETVEENIIELEQITDDFSVKFSEWVTIMYPNQRKFLTGGDKRGFRTTTELLKIFKENYYE